MKSIVTKIAESEIKEDSIKRKYKIVTFEKINDDVIDHPILKLISIVGKVKHRMHRCYADSFGKPDLGYNEPIGTHFFGDIITKEVEPYDIVNKESRELVRRVNTLSMVVFGDSTSEIFHLEINKAFESSGFKLINRENENLTIAK